MNQENTETTITEKMINIDETLSRKECQDIINSTDFYFQKGQEALQKWMNFPVSDELKDTLISLAKDYIKIQEKAKKSSELKEALDLLFAVIAYCDLHAKDKNILNQYDDKRTLAFAFVRMNTWIEKLIQYRFLPKEVGAGSPQNAFNYLLDPKNNSTILSENHRKLISENLLQKPYNQAEFVTELEFFFKSYNIKTYNSKNYSHLLMHVVYSLQDQWKDEVIGLMASDGTGWQDAYVQEMQDYDSGIIWNSKRPSGTGKTIKFLKDIIAEGGSFNLYYCSGGVITHKASIIDFVENDQELEKKQWNQNQKVYEYQANFNNYVDGKKSAKIVFLAESLEKTDPIAISNFEFYNGYSAPTQDNLSPIKKEPILMDTIPTANFNQIVEALKKEIEIDKRTKGLFVFNKTSKSGFVWIRDAHDLIGDISAHYEILTRKGEIFVELHFEGKPETKAQFNSVIDNLPEKLKAIAWSGARSISYKKGNSFDDPNLVNQLKDQLFYLETSIGNEIRNILTSNKTEPGILKINNERSLNQILYGPPGTGKTYNTINKALQIINEEEEKKLDWSNRKSVKAQFEKRMQEGRIIFTTFHQSMTYEDFIEGIKPLPPIPGESQSDIFIEEKESLQAVQEQSLKYDIRAGIFKRACVSSAYLCYKEYIQLKRKSIVYSFDDLYEAFVLHVEEQLKIKTLPTYKSITGKEIEIYKINSQDSIKARSKGSKSTDTAPLTKENLQKLYDKFDVITEIENLQQIRDTVQVLPRSTEFYAVFRGIKEFEKTYKPEASEEVAVDKIDEIEKQKKFDAGVYNDAIRKFGKDGAPVVLIIDEINRGNVSQVFGELITLIEHDKRIGQDEALEVILPYSQKKFGVPPNLYIIGTMNTADRSVEALDTALRRRFCFEEMPPKYDLPELQCEFVGCKVYEILGTLNKRIEKLVDKDHQIGHSYFMIKEGESIEKKLLNSFYSNIIPLLQEYFFGDFGKIGLVLGKGFLIMKEWDKNSDSFADFDYQSSSEFVEREVFGIIDYRKPQTKYTIRIKDKEIQMDFQKAIKLLMKKDIE